MKKELDERIQDEFENKTGHLDLTWLQLVGTPK